MDAEEAYESSDAKAVGAYYTDLSSRGPDGELAMHLLRAYRSTARIGLYDDPKYREFLRGRCRWSIEQLKSLLEKDAGTERFELKGHSFSVRLGKRLIRFHRKESSEWVVRQTDKPFIFAFCNKVMEGAKDDGA
jgi:hypothetical protein